jgi:hypothetical protein
MKRSVFTKDETGYAISDSRHPKFDARSEKCAHALLCSFNLFISRHPYFVKHQIREDIVQEMYLQMLRLGYLSTRLLFLNAIHQLYGRRDLLKNKGELVTLTGVERGYLQEEVEDTRLSICYLSELKEEKDILIECIGDVISGKICHLQPNKHTNKEKMSIFTKWVSANRPFIMNRKAFAHLLEQSKSVGKEKMSLRHYKIFFGRIYIQYIGPTHELVEDRTHAIKSFLCRCRSTGRYVLETDFGEAIDTLQSAFDDNTYLHDTLTRLKAEKNEEQQKEERRSKR